MNNLLNIFEFDFFRETKMNKKKDFFPFARVWNIFWDDKYEEIYIRRS